MNETVGLGGFAMACAFALQDYQGGSPEAMIRINQAMYDITCGENPHYNIPYFGFRGTPTGIDIFNKLQNFRDVKLYGQRTGMPFGGRPPVHGHGAHHCNG